MKVALEAAALGDAGLDDPRPRGAQLLEARAQLGVEALVLERERGGAADGLEQILVVLGELAGG